MILAADGIPLKGTRVDSEAGDRGAALERVLGSRVLFRLTGAGPLLPSVRVTLHPFTYSGKPKAESCLLHRLKVTKQPSVAPPTVLPGLCGVNVALV